jgi:hypothetical protein
MISKSASNVTLESFHFIGGGEVDQPSRNLYDFFYLISHNMPNLSDLRFSIDLSYSPNYITHYLEFLGFKKSLKTAHFETRYGEKKYF